MSQQTFEGQPRRKPFDALRAPIQAVQPQPDNKFLKMTDAEFQQYLVDAGQVFDDVDGEDSRLSLADLIRGGFAAGLIALPVIAMLLK